jgi:hypothetical protein
LIDDVLKYEKRLFAQIMAQQRAISALFEEFTRSVAPYLAQYKSRGVVADSVWNRNIKIESAINAQLVRLQKDLTEYLNAQSVKAWNLSHDKTDLIVKDYIKSMAISDVARQGLFFRNVDALKAFQNRAVNGMNLSQRVWKICAETKSQLELYLQSGLSQGRSAAQISRDVRGFLKEPDKRFRRVRDPETGKLKPSIPMKDYHPGRGVYRSSAKNALRLARTETNMAYRRADLARWRSIDFITGYEVRLSDAHPEPDICNSMAGKYPKNFTFVGWHPHCWCHSVPVMLPQDKFVDYINSGKMPAHDKVKGIPPKAFNYVRDRSDKLSRYKTPPFFLENFTKKHGTFYPKKILY